MPQTVRFVNNGLSKHTLVCMLPLQRSCNNHTQTSGLGHTGTLMPCFGTSGPGNPPGRKARGWPQTHPRDSGHSACRRAPPRPSPQPMAMVTAQGPSRPAWGSGSQEVLPPPLPVTFACATQPQAPSGTSPTNKQGPSLPIPTLSRCFLGPFALPAKL